MGMVQLGIIFANSMMLKYAAYTVARVVVVYDEDRERRNKALIAEKMLKMQIAYANTYKKSGAGIGADLLRSLGTDVIAGIVEKSRLEIEEKVFEKSKSKFLKVTITYNMPLTVPFVNKVFNAIGVGFGGITSYKIGKPYYPLKASAIMRYERNVDESDKK